MSEAARLRHLVVKFLRLETLAETLYAQHLPSVGRELRPLFEEFVRVETRHRELFAHYYRTLYGDPVPTFRLSIFGCRLISIVLHLFGTKAVLRFECWIESLAVSDYTDALEWIEEPTLRRLIHEVLRDEMDHLPFTEALLQFREDEAEHIQRMQKIITQSRSSSRS